MFAKQTIMSASLVALLGGSSIAFADDDPEQPASGEVHPEEAEPAEPVEKPKTGIFMIGAGFSSVESFVATATIAQPDLFGTGYGLALSARISKLRQLFSIRFTDPSLFRSGYALTTELFHDERVLPGFTRVASGGALTLSREIAPHVRTFATYRLEQVSRNDDGGWIARSTGLGETAPIDPLISSLRGGLEYNTLDDPLMPTRGTRIGGSIEIADRRLGSDVDLMRTEAWANTHAPLGPFTLHLGGRVSTVTGEVPSTERLFLDPREVRGFLPGDLGPIDGWGMPVGGTMKISGRAELELPVFRRLGISTVGFLDAGGVLDRGFGGTGMSYGLGLIWRSPIGPLRFDWAWRADGGPPVFGFGIGF